MKPANLVTLALLALSPPALAAGGTVEGTVTATPAKYLPETVVWLKDAPFTAAPKKQSLDQKGMKFIPPVLAVTVGDTVDFLNHDTVDHNVYSPDGTPFNLGNFKQNETRSQTFAKAGPYTLLCSIHPEMLGYIVVTPTPYHAVVDAKGAFKIENVPAGTWTVEVWNAK